jgi:hypothetical protein
MNTDMLERCQDFALNAKISILRCPSKYSWMITVELVKRSFNTDKNASLSLAILTRFFSRFADENEPTLRMRGKLNSFRIFS